MIHDTGDLLRRVRITLDQNEVNEALAGIGDPDTLTLDEIIASKIEAAAAAVVTACPTAMLGGGEPMGESIAWIGEPGHSGGRIDLPKDFLRLVVFKMNDWKHGVYNAITPASPQYIMQSSPYKGVRGTPWKPVVAIVDYPGGQMLEFYSSDNGDEANIAVARYQPRPHIKGRSIEIPALLCEAVVDYTAYLTALLLGDNDKAAALLSMARTAAGINEGKGTE